jgi:hypothetical protein
MGFAGAIGWAFGRDAFVSLFAGVIIGLLKRAKAFTKRQDPGEIYKRGRLKESFSLW